MGGGRHSSTHTLKTWWTCAITKDNFIQAMALKITSLTSHNISCERIFSILGLNINRLEIMSKLHLYYVTNAQTELKHMHCEEISENQIDIIIHSIQYNKNEELNEIEEFEDEEINETNETNESNDSINNYFNFSSEQFCKVMEINVSVVIEQELEILHGDLNFDNNKLLNNILN
ncbi:hypothetical protein Glove_74g175 [Diversispora epigaea]|uniref:HAT C-terminal dimerisation domain-containing protein n=1 Tax=Diversispora epigaea TaxID=1348612 RepID=A0A397JIP0_9GLOM|nr:hypothetical protein Glove_74g175 [Diversispora epigaea]